MQERIIMVVQRTERGRTAVELEPLPPNALKSTQCQEVSTRFGVYPAARVRRSMDSDKLKIRWLFQWRYPKDPGSRN